MTRRFITALLLASCAHAAGAVEFGNVLADKSAITFISKQMGVPVNGRFGKFGAQIAFDPARADAAKIGVTVDTGSIDAGSKEANDEVVGKPWFNAGLFPNATFTAARVKALGGGRFEAAGTLAIKGKSQPVAVPFTYKVEGGNAVFDGGFTVKRFEYAVGEGVWADFDTIANDVKVNFHIVVAPNTGTAAAKGK